VNLRRALTLGALSGVFAVACGDREQLDRTHSPELAEPVATAERASQVTPSQVTPEAPATPPSREATQSPALEPPTASSADDAQAFVVVAGGDVSFGRECGQRLLEDSDYNPLAELTPIFEAADLSLVNLESPLTDQGGETQSPKNRLIFTGPPEGALSLANAGVDVVSVANNHAWDYGQAGFLETLDHLGLLGVGVVGGSQIPEQQYHPLVFRAKGYSVAIFGVTGIWNQGPFETHPGRHHVAWAHFDKLHGAILRARRKHDLVFVMYHGGGEYIDIPMHDTRRFIDKLMRARVDAVLGHHPHVLQGVRWFGQRPAFYSLGNLVFNLNPRYAFTDLGALARLTFRRDQAPRLELCPYRIQGHTPRLFTGDEQAQLEQSFRERFLGVAERVGGSQLGPAGEHGCMQVSPP